MVDKGEFRNDLYYRINVFPIHLPSLSERVDDIPLLANALLKRIAHGSKYTLSESGLKALKTITYKGNIRELRNILSRAIVLSDTDEIDEKTVMECNIEQAVQIDLANSGNSGNLVDDEPDLKNHEGQYIETLLQRHEGNKGKVAEILGISVRSLYRKMRN